MKRENASKVALIASMTIFGTIGIFKTYIPLPSSVIAFARAFIGALFLLAVIAIRRHKIDGGAIRKNLVFIIVSGILLGFNWILLFESFNYTSVAVGTLCYYMAPVILILVSPALFKEKLGARKIICLLLAVAGITLVSGVFDGSLSLSVKGIGLGLAAAVLYAAIVVCNKYIKNVDPFDKTIIQLGISALTLIPYILFTERLTQINFSTRSIVLLMIIGIIHTGIAYALYFGSIEKTKTQTVALFSYIDPVLAVLLSALLLKEPMSVYQIVGAVLIIGSAIYNEVFL